MERKILYFGYGANKDRGMMAAITGNAQLIGKTAVLKGWELCIQRLDQVPDTISPTSPTPLSPQQIIRENWNEDFESYTIRPAEGKRIQGTLWELTPQERDLVRDWELIEFGWYKDAKVKVATTDAQDIEVQTEVLGDDQKIDRVVDGRDYPPFLNEVADFQRVAEKSRREYFERLAKEGSTPIEG